MMIRLVCRIKIQRRLLQVTYKAALEIAQAMELADHDTHHLQSQAHSLTAAVQTSGESEVRRGSKAQASKVTTTSRSINSCYRCGSPATFKFKQAECYLCKKIGHIAKDIVDENHEIQRAGHLGLSCGQLGNSLDNPAPTDYSLFTLHKPIVVTVKVNK